MLEFYSFTVVGLLTERETRTWVFVDRERDRLLFETTKSEQGKPAAYNCQVQRWDSSQFTFIPIPAEQSRYCDPKTGKHNPTASHLSILPRPPPL